MPETFWPVLIFLSFQHKNYSIPFSIVKKQVKCRSWHFLRDTLSWTRLRIAGLRGCPEQAGIHAADSITSHSICHKLPPAGFQERAVDQGKARSNLERACSLGIFCKVSQPECCFWALSQYLPCPRKRYVGLLVLHNNHRNEESQNIWKMFSWCCRIFWGKVDSCWHQYFWN